MDVTAHTLHMVEGNCNAQGKQGSSALSQDRPEFCEALPPTQPVVVLWSMCVHGWCMGARCECVSSLTSPEVPHMRGQMVAWLIHRVPNTWVCQQTIRDSSLNGPSFRAIAVLDRSGKCTCDLIPDA